MISSHASEHVVNLITLVSDQDIDWSTLIDRTPLLNLADDRLHTIFHLLISLTRCRTGLMMCSIYIDESATHVAYCMTVTSLCTFSLKGWTVCLTVWITGTRCTILKTMHSSGRAGMERTPITVAAWRFTGYNYLHRLALITISQFFFLFHLLLGFFSIALC
jgi:hypothetical protein